MKACSVKKTLTTQLRQIDESNVDKITIDGEPWLVAMDVCRILELGNTTEALRRLDEDELTSVKLKSGGQMRKMKLVNEPGLYRLVFASRNKKNPRDAVKKHVPDKYKKDGVAIRDPIGRQQKVVVINEAGMYKLVMRSRTQQKNPRDALKDHVPEKYKLGERIVTSGQRRAVTLINEAGMYKLVMRCSTQQKNPLRRVDLFPKLKKALDERNLY